MYEPVTPAAKADGTKQSMAAGLPKDSGRFLRIPLTEEVVMMADEDDDDDDDDNGDGNRTTATGKSEVKGRRRCGKEDGTEEETDEVLLCFNHSSYTLIK